MALSRQEIQKKSDDKRGVKVKGFKLSLETIALVERLSEATGEPQATIITKALEAYAKALEQ